MRKSRFFDSHTNGKPTLNHAKYANKCGVYFIKSKATGVIVYVGSSATQLYKTIYRHFQEWNDRSRGKGFDRTTYGKNSYQISVLLTANADQALRIEKYFIGKLKPAGNPIKYELLLFSKSEMDKIENSYKNADFIPLDKIREAPF